MRMPTNVTPGEAATFMQERPVDAYTLLDVRQDWEYAEGHVPGARLLPLPEIADRFVEVPKDRPVLAYCRSGKRSLAAAGLLAGQGYEVLNILGGMTAWEGAAAEGPPEQGMAWLPEDASLDDVLALAYAMEVNLGAFYEACAEEAPDEERKKTFLSLARFEDGHKAMVLRLARGLAGAPGAEELMRRASGLAALEGGFAPEEVKERYRLDRAEPLEIYEAALAFEAQALDLYLRAEPRVAGNDARAVLRELADEEKRHLAVVGRMMERAGG